jgi:AhpD family alkylhydroperoxidase
MSLASLEIIGQQQPEVVQALVQLKDKVFAEGALSVKEKALIALALGCSLKCNTCIEVNSQLAIDSGASRDELRETLIVAMYMAGPSAVVWTPKVAEILSK